MPSISLYPPLEQIENSLFSISDDLLHKLAIKDKSLTKELCEAALADETTAIKVDVFREALSHPIEIESSVVIVFSFSLHYDETSACSSREINIVWDICNVNLDCNRVAILFRH